MHGWIKDIEVKIQEFRGPPKVNPVVAKSLLTVLSILEGICDKINTDVVSVSPFAGVFIQICSLSLPKSEFFLCVTSSPEQRGQTPVGQVQLCVCRLAALDAHPAKRDFIGGRGRWRQRV